ncbi:MAG: Zn-dependent exopeptidase M28 [Clostridiales bacterium]|nr:Zn-dependent exopeptidase M28 [Clostridiales bacterium]
MELKDLKGLKQQMADYMEEGIAEVIKSFGKRSPGSEGEKQCAEYFKNELEKYCENVKIESFSLHPGSFFGWIYITVTFMLAATALYFFVPLASAILVVLGFILMLTQFVLYRKTFDFLFKKKTSYNVYGSIPAKGETKRKVIFSGHMDAANEWPLSYRLGGSATAGLVSFAFIGILYIFAISIYSLVTNGIGFALNTGIDRILGYVSLVFVPIFITMYHFSSKKVVTDGANDNLSGCFIAAAIVKAMKENGVQLENTEVVALMTGAEEAGLRGAKAFVKAHREELKKTETVFVGFDTIREMRFLAVNKADINNTVKNNEEYSDLYIKAAENLGYKCASSSVPIGATDAAAFSQEGLKGVSITALDHNLRDYYHTRRDTIDNIDKECLRDVWEITVEYLDLIDKGEPKK